MSKVALVSEARSSQPMGLETAELRLLDALRARADGIAVELRVVGGRGARRYARAAGGVWVPSLRRRASRLAGRGADLVHLTGLGLPAPRCRYVVSVHDLAPLRFADEGELPDWAGELARRAARVVCPSQFTAGELVAVLGADAETIRVVPNGPGRDTASASPLADEELAELGLTRPLVVRLGGYTERKNVPLLLAAWPAVHARTGGTLALAGPAQAGRDAMLAAAPSLDGVRVLGYVDDELAARLVRSADAVASTSRYEGFGLPPLEAMAAGTPVVATRTPFAEEVCGDAALLVDAEPDAVADALVRVCEDGELRERLGRAGVARAAAFTWDRAAERLLAVYRELL